MCGIAGWLDLKRGTSVDTMRRIANEMCDAIQHRGPDDHGYWVDEKTGVALGHRRLSIFDLSDAGRQPMVSNNGRYVLTFNGEIYNFLDMKKEVADYPFKSGTDTEVFLAWIERFGIEAAIDAHNGMLAAAVWDKQEEKLHLVRDRLGQKPLYYGTFGDTFVYGSELDALRAHPNVSPSIDRNAAQLFAWYKNIPAPFSIFENILKVMPATHLVFDPKTRKKTERLYWSRTQLVHQNRNESNPLESLNELLRDATKKRMASHVSLGAFLSGGIDSSLIVGLMQTQSDVPIQTYSIGFEEASHDESKHAEAVARFLGTDHTTWTVTANDALDAVPELPRVYDEPFADASQLPTLLLCQKTRQKVTVALSGDGGDEIFGGYPRYIPSRFDRMMGSSKRRKLARLFGATSVLTKPSWDKNRASVRSSASESDAERYLTRMRTWKRPRPVAVGVKSVEDPYSNLNERLGFRELGMYMDQEGYLPDDILVKVDRASMSVALECRAPILDHRVSEFSWRLTDEQRCGESPKGLLKELAYTYVPKTILDRPKQGFGIPVNAWLRNELRTWAGDLLSPTSLRKTGVFQPNMVDAVWREHQKGTANWGADLWTILMFEAWAQTHL